eukprot:3437502-Rhodomonas_salina.2
MASEAFADIVCGHRRRHKERLTRPSTPPRLHRNSGPRLRCETPLPDLVHVLISLDPTNEIILSCSFSRTACFFRWKRAELLKKTAEVMRSQAQEIAKVIQDEVAKPNKAAVSEVMRTADLLDYTAEEGLRLNGELLTSDSFVGEKRNRLCLVQVCPICCLVVPISTRATSPRLVRSDLNLRLRIAMCAICAQLVELCISSWTLLSMSRAESTPVLTCSSLRSQRVPLGVVVAVPPFNYPLNLAGSKLGIYLLLSSVHHAQIPC